MASDRFLQAVASVLEVDEINPATRFRETPDWSSLKAFGLLVLMENDFNAPISIERLKEFLTVRDLELEAFLAFAADILKVPRASLSGDTTYGSLVEWDSVNHLRLCMEAEKRFGFSYPIERIPSLKKLTDFLP